MNDKTLHAWDEKPLLTWKTSCTTSQWRPTDCTYNWKKSSNKMPNVSSRLEITIYATNFDMGRRSDKLRGNINIMLYFNVVQHS